MDKEKVFEITLNHLNQWSLVRFILFWVCVVAIYFQSHALSIVLCILMLLTIRIRKVEEKTYELEYGVIPLIKRVLHDKESN